MNLSLGIDIGSSSTKAAALDEHGALLGTLQVHADDPRTSAYGVLGRFLDQQGASFDDVEKIVLTGLGSTWGGQTKVNLFLKKDNNSEQPLDYRGKFFYNER